MVILRHYSVYKRIDKPKKEKKTAKYGKVESTHIGMVPAKQLHLPVMGVYYLVIFRGCMVTAYQHQEIQY